MHEIRPSVITVTVSAKGLRGRKLRGRKRGPYFILASPQTVNILSSDGKHTQTYIYNSLEIIKVSLVTVKQEWI